MSARHRLRNALLRPAGHITRRKSLSESNTILIFQPDHLGDILLSQPAVDRIRHAYPEHHLIAVVGPWSKQIARHVWQVDDIVTVDFPGFNRDISIASPLTPYLQLQEQAAFLRPLDAILSFILRPDAWWAAWLATLVTGGSVVTSDDPATAAFGTCHAVVDERDHATARAISIAEASSPGPQRERVTSQSDPLSMPNQPEAAQAARQHLDELGIAATYTVIHPGAGAAVKLWPDDRWRHVAAALASDAIPVLVTGTESEQLLAQAVASDNPNVTSIAGRTPLAVLIEILRGANLVLGPDSGPLHLAVACGTPTVHLYGPSDSLRYGPWGPSNRHRAITMGWSCPRCGDLSSARTAGCGCMLAIEPHTVIDAAQHLLSAHVHQ